jgi:hypothetical protein
VFLATRGIDMRKQINGLAGIVQREFNVELYDGAMFVFCNNRKNIIKILCWDIDGFVLYCKRKEKGRFFWPGFPADSESTVSVDENDLNRLLDGLSMEKFVPKRSYALI